jgi:hypothetical protein
LGVNAFTTKVITTFYRRLYLVAKPMDVIVDEQSDLVTSIRPLRADEVESYTQQSKHHQANAFNTRISRGDQCFAVFNGSRIIHSGWAATGTAHLDYLNQLLVLQPHEIYQYETYTVPEYRKHRLANIRSTYVVRYYGERGYTRFYGTSTPENIAGLNALLSVKYTIIGILSYLRLGPLQRHWQQQLTDMPLPELKEKT